MSGVERIATSEVDLTNSQVQALCEWLEFHGIKSAHCCRYGYIDRVPDRNMIRWLDYERNAAGHPVMRDMEVRVVERVEVGEGAPRPFPAEVADLVSAHTGDFG